MTFHLTSPTTRRRAAELQFLFGSAGRSLVCQLNWALNNLAFLLILGALTAIQGLVLDVGATGERIGITVIALTRTAGDYHASRDFYFPPAVQDAQSSNDKKI